MWEARPFALETFGRLGRVALRHLRELARAQEAALQEEVADGAAATLMHRWGNRLSVALHRANVRNVVRSLGRTGSNVQARCGFAEAL